MSRWTICCCIFISLLKAVTVQATCNSSSYGYSGSLSSVETNLGSDTGRTYLSSYTIQCTGTVSAWKFYARRSGTIYLQIWRRYNSTSSYYQLIGQNQITVPAGTTYQEQYMIIPVPPDMRISVQSGDYIGWTPSSNEMITYGSVSGTNINYISPASVVIGSWQPFTSSLTNRMDAVMAHMDDSLQPVFTNILTALEVDRNVSVGSTLLTLKAKDKDVSDSLTLSATSASIDLTFNSSSGTVSKAATLTQTTYTVSTTVTDQSGLSTSQTIAVTAYNHAPIITNLPACITILEDSTAINTVIFTVTATDDDQDTVSCSLSTVIPSGRAYSIFGTAIKDPGGSRYYCDATPYFRIEVTCTDGKGGSSISALHVDITKNNPPVFDNLPGFLTIGQTNWTNIFNVSVTDTDNTVPNQMKYTLSCATGSCNYFIDSAGRIQTNNSLTGSIGNDLLITVSDVNTTVSTYLSVLIPGHDADPAITNLPLTNPIYIMENTPIGTTIYVVQFEDLNQNQVLTLSASIPALTSTYYSVNTTTGVITIKAIIDYDNISSTSLGIVFTVFDGSYSQNYAFDTTIRNVNEAPSFASPSYSISRNEGLRGDVFNSPGFVVHDPDAGDTFMYFLDCGDYTKYFTMSMTTFNVSFARDYSRDSGLPGIVKCVATVKDARFLSATTSLTITVNQINDHRPVCGKKTYFFILDNSVANFTVIGDVSASDADSDMYGSINGNMTYTLLDSANAHFYINSTSGLLSTISSLTTFDKGSYISFRFQAADAGGMATTCTVSILFPAEYVITTTTTETPIPFQKDGRNMIWMTLTGMALIVLLIVILHILSKTQAMKQCCAPTNWNRPQSPRYQKRRPPRRAGRYGRKNPVDILELDNMNDTKTEVPKNPTQTDAEPESRVKSRTFNSQPEPDHEVQSLVSTRNEAITPAVGWHDF